LRSLIHCGLRKIEPYLTSYKNKYFLAHNIPISQASDLGCKFAGVCPTAHGVHTPHVRMQNMRIITLLHLFVIKAQICGLNAMSLQFGTKKKSSITVVFQNSHI